MANVRVVDPAKNTKLGVINTVSGTVKVTLGTNGRIDAYGEREALITYLVAYQGFTRQAAAALVPGV